MSPLDVGLGDLLKRAPRLPHPIVFHVARELVKVGGRPSLQGVRISAHGDVTLADPPPPGGRADVFCLGAVLFEVLSGVPPFQGRTPDELARAIEFGSAPKLSVFAPDAPPWLAAWVDGALSRDPAARPGLAALERGLDGQAADGRGAVAALVQALEPSPVTPAGAITQTVRRELEPARVTANPSAKAHLERLLDDERMRWAVVLTRLRFGVALVAALFVIAVPERANPSFAPSLWGGIAFVAISAALLLLAHRSALWRRVSAFAIPLIDVPLISWLQARQGQLLDEPWQGLATAIALPFALLTLSMLSLSRPVIALTAVAVTISVVRRLLSIDVPPIPLALSCVMPAAMGLIGWQVVDRVRGLLYESRKRDLVGKYILGERLGVGGMAEVYRATYSPEGGFERQVAIKRILPAFADRPEAGALFRREAELGAGLAHPNVVQVLDFGHDEGGYFIAMELVDGVPLHQVLSRARRAGDVLSWPVCCYVVEELARALEYIHSRTSSIGAPLGLVHRDVNPPNVLVSKIGEVKLNDFGIARAASGTQLTADGVVRGKLAFSAPEQLTGKRVDARADLWALGVTAYTVMASQQPFESADEGAVLRACLDGPIPTLSSARADAPPALEALVAGLLTREPDLRTGTATAVLGQLARIGAPWVDPAMGRLGLAALVAAVRAEGH